MRIKIEKSEVRKMGMKFSIDFLRLYAKISKLQSEQYLALNNDFCDKDNSKNNYIYTSLHDLEIHLEFDLGFTRAEIDEIKDRSIYFNPECKYFTYVYFYVPDLTCINNIYSSDDPREVGHTSFSIARYLVSDDDYVKRDLQARLLEKLLRYDDLKDVGIVISNENEERPYTDYTNDTKKGTYDDFEKLRIIQSSASYPRTYQRLEKGGD